MKQSKNRTLLFLVIVIAGWFTLSMNGQTADRPIYDRLQSLDNDFEPQLLKYPAPNLLTGAFERKRMA